MGVSIMRIVGALLLVVPLMLAGTLLTSTLSGLPIWLFYIVAYFILFAIYYFILGKVMGLAGPLALKIAIILPFIVGGLTLLTG